MHSLIKTNDSQKTVTFAVLVPNEPDLVWDVIDAQEIIKTAHDFMLNLTSKTVNIDHQEGTDQSEVQIVESFVTPIEMTVGGGVIPQGTRMVALKFLDDNMYQDVLDWKYVGVSMEGFRKNE